MRALALALVASLAHAQPVDAPLGEPRAAMTLKAGEVVPFDGVCMDDARAILTGKRLAGAEAQVKSVEGKTVISTPLLVAGIIAAVVVSGAVGAGVALAVKR